MRRRPPANPPNRFLSTFVEYDDDHPGVGVEVIWDQSRSIVSRNDSPDVPFTHSVNPYRGCQHACAYCYARPTHEYLGLGAGTDFETRLFAKARAGALLAEAFAAPSWSGAPLAFSGVTDPYQPIEAKLGLTRACLQVCLTHRQPVGIVTKGTTLLRDLPLLRELHAVARVEVRISIPFLDPNVARVLEPGAPPPERRFELMAAVADAGLPVGLMAAPIVPGLSDAELPRLLRRAKEAGATSATPILLRLPGSTAEVFEQRLRHGLPLQAERVLHRLRESQGGKLYDARFGVRGKGEGPYADAIRALFRSSCETYGLATTHEPAPPTTFARPPARLQQLALAL